MNIGGKMEKNQRKYGLKTNNPQWQRGTKQKLTIAATYFALSLAMIFKR